jgi:uncharacterized coiled-coil protein SlyX
VSTVEERLAALEERVGMEAGLRAAGDSDLASLSLKLSAQHHLIQALSITQSEHTGEFTKIHTKLDTIVNLLTTLIERGDGHDSDDNRGAR